MMRGVTRSAQPVRTIAKETLAGRAFRAARDRKFACDNAPPRSTGRLAASSSSARHVGAKVWRADHLRCTKAITCPTCVARRRAADRARSASRRRPVCNRSSTCNRRRTRAPGNGCTRADLVCDETTVCRRAHDDRCDRRAVTDRSRPSLDANTWSPSRSTPETDVPSCHIDPSGAPRAAACGRNACGAGPIAGTLSAVESGYWQNATAHANRERLNWRTASGQHGIQHPPAHQVESANAGLLVNCACARLTGVTRKTSAIKTEDARGRAPSSKRCRRNRRTRLMSLGRRMAS